MKWKEKHVDIEHAVWLGDGSGAYIRQEHLAAGTRNREQIFSLHS